MSDTQPPQPERPRLNPGVVAVILALAAAVIGTGVILATRTGGDATPPAVEVMPGHGAVMPTDVDVVAAAGELKVAMGDYWFKPSARRLPAGRYTLTGQNVGFVEHDLMLEKFPIRMAGPGQPDEAAATYGLESMEPKTTSRREVTLDAGTWVLFCSVPGHYRAGQRITVRVYGQLPAGTRRPPETMGSDRTGAGGTGERS